MLALKGLFLLFILFPQIFCDNIAIELLDESCEEFDTDESEDGTSNYLSSVSTSVKFLLITPDNNTVPLNSKNKHLVKTSQPTKLLVHGLGTYEESTWIDTMAFLYHTHGNYNIIAVDWSAISVKTTDLLVSEVDAVGNVVANFLMEVTETDVAYMTDVHMIGSSVGAHVSGAAGENIARQGNGTKIGRITGLDPQQPKDLEILDGDDADFVDVIHTSAILGQRQVGTVDFYVVDGTDGKPICYKRNSTNSTVNSKVNNNISKANSTTNSKKKTHNTDSVNHKNGTKGHNSTKSHKKTQHGNPNSTKTHNDNTNSTKTQNGIPNSTKIHNGNANSTKIHNSTHHVNPTNKTNSTHLDDTKKSSKKMFTIDDDDNYDDDDDNCGELLASDFYIMTIEDGQRFEGVSCHDADAVVKNLCDKDNSAYMGEYVSRNVSGNYLVYKDSASGLHSEGKLILSVSVALILWYLCI